MSRLSSTTHDLCRRAQAGEHGSRMKPADFTMDHAGDLAGLSNEMKYARAVKLIAARAPLRVLPGEPIVGSATLLEATCHKTPVFGNPSTSHTTIGFDRALRIGYSGLRRQIDERLARGGLDDKGVDLLHAMRVCLDAADIWHQRHIDLLQQRGSDNADALAALRRVPNEPPATFHEAVQALWFMYAFQRLCGNWSGIGRIDQMLGPHLQADLAAGRITLDDARELIAHFWIKGCEWIGAQNQHQGSSGDGQFYQNVILSGIDADGRDVTNDVTYLVLDVVEELRISDFPIAVRICERTPERLLRRIAEVERLGGGTVAVYSEDLVIDALVRFGYPLEQARTFANDGCWEVIIPGKTVFSYRPFDMLLLLQQTLGLPGTDGHPAFATFDDLYAAFKTRLSDALQQQHAETDAFAREANPATLISIFVDDCIERGRGYRERGARYAVRAPHAGGLGDTANALLVIKTLVYDEHAITLEDLVAALCDDWAGQEELRRRIRSRFDFYGNDNAPADAMVRRVFDDYTALVGQVRERNGVLRPAGLSTFGRQIEYAKSRGATAAGTRMGDVLANNFSPAPGTDRRGPTAVIKSFCAVDYRKLPNGTALDLKVNPSGLKGERGVRTLVSLLKTFVQLGGWFMHIDAVDVATLRDAQAHPDKYPNLAVRIAGWSARFATLSKQWQDMIIERTQQEVG